MKKLSAMILALVMCLSLAACGGPDKQPAIDAYNELANNYNAFVEVANEDLENWAEEDIEFMNGCADVITRYGTELESDKEFTQEELDEMVEMFKEFNAVIAEYMAAYEE